MTLKRSDTSRSCISKQFKSCMSGTSEPPASRSSGLDKEIWKNEITALLLWFLPLLPPLFYFTGGGRQVRRKGDTCSCILEATLTYAQRQLKPQEPMPSFPDRMSQGEITNPIFYIKISLISSHVINSMWRSRRILQVFENV